ncbi:hypothetical protein GYMLUDRAFT_37958 [Collybiopsis luxurians FD-317 M1]|nr:hypothetical protein GYMLUDRAFT_37958 [Collybiopsis luxurians FD-317 M1]
MAEFEPVLLTLPSLAPSLVVEILPYGLTFHRVFVQADGRTHDIVIGPEEPRGHITQRYTNTIIGRYANRVPVGKHSIERNGFNAEVVAELNEGTRVSLHGGPVGFDSVPWKLLSSSSTPALFTPSELSHFPSPKDSRSYGIFQLVSPDGDQGYPGQLTVEVLIAVIPPADQEQTYLEKGESKERKEWDLGSIVYVYRAKVDKGVTPVNLTQHWGFNLEASLKEDEETLLVKNHNITIKADRIVARDKDSLNTGSFIGVETEAPEHLHNGQKIGDKYPELGYDDYYAFAPRTVKIPKRLSSSEFTPELDLLKDILTPSGAEGGARGDRPDPVVELSSDKSGLKLLFDTNQDGTMFYSNAWADPSRGARKKIHGGSGIMNNGDGYIPGSAAFLEFHDVLAAFLDPTNKDGNDTLLTENEIYHNYVRCDLRFEQPIR